MPERIQEQKPGSSLRGSSSKKAQQQPPAVEAGVDDKCGAASNSDDTSHNNNQNDNDDNDSLRHESPPSKLRQTMDFVNQLRYRCGAIVNNENVQFFIVILIAINAVMMGVGTFDFVTENPQVEQAFEITDKVFLILFTIELCMQFIFHGWRLLLDGWLVFDLIVIVMSWSFQQVQIIRAFRIFRALRLITRIEVMKNLVLGEYNSLQVLVNIRALLVSGVCFDEMYTLWMSEAIDHLRSKSKGSANTSLFRLLSFNSAVWCHAKNVCHWYSALFSLLYFCGHVHTAL